MRRNVLGFTLIELMIVVAIIGILAAIAAPNYRYFLTQAKLTDALTVLGKVQRDISAFYYQTGRFPVDTNELGKVTNFTALSYGGAQANGGLAVNSPYVQYLTCPGWGSCDQFAVYLNLNALGISAAEAPSAWDMWFVSKVDAKGNVTWVCAPAQRGGAATSRITNLNYLPTTCRNPAT